MISKHSRREDEVYGIIGEHLKKATFLFWVDGIAVFLSNEIVEGASSCLTTRLRNTKTGVFEFVIFVSEKIMADKDTADMVIAHELGHIRLGESCFYLDDLDVEIQADKFAMEYLDLSGDEARDLMTEGFVVMGIDLEHEDIAARLRAFDRYV